MTDDRLLNDDLEAAFRSVRDAYDGTSPESNSTLQRALFRTRTTQRRSRLTRWVVLPIAAVLAASTAWAGVTGKLAPAMQSVLESLHAERTPPAPAPSHPPASIAATASAAPPFVGESTPAESPPDEVPPPEVAAPAEPAPPAPAARPAAVPTARPASASAAPARSEAPASSVAVVPSAPASTPDPHAALFAEAHRLHFIERDPARALAAWDRYLATAPDGRFTPEARYNRALALIRLGRVAEAKTDLAAFASGTYGNYRRDEARALLDALARDAAAP